jgi:hypothetical protein
VLAKARALTPWDRSPAVRSVLAARNGLAKAPGPFKAVVLISDCVDTRFAEDPTFDNPKRAVKDVLRGEFTAGTVPLAVVALPVWDAAEVAAQNEFKVVEEKGQGGRFVPPPRAGEVAKWLGQGLRSRMRYTIEPAEPGGSAVGGDLTVGTLGADEWYAGRLRPGKYRVQVPGVPGAAWTVELAAGDRFLMELTEDRGRLQLRRAWTAATDPAVVRTTSESGSWKLALWQNRPGADGRLDLLAALEPDPKLVSPVAPARVRDAWFEVTPATPGGPVAVRWQSSVGFPAPAWSLGVGGWPTVPGGGPAAPVVEAWWSPDAPFPKAATWTVPPGGLKPGPLGETVAGTGVTIESVTLETHTVTVRPGESAPRTCLVVRLTHPENDPHWARPEGPAPAGSEVRVFRPANKVTCLFWWASEAPPDVSKLTGFELVSRAAAVRRAEQTRHHLRLVAPGPSASSPDPQPPAPDR